MLAAIAIVSPKPVVELPDISATREAIVGRFLRAALLEMRALAREGRNEQVAALADAVHNVPSAFADDRLDATRLRGDVQAYLMRYPGRHRFDLMALIDQL